MTIGGVDMIITISKTSKDNLITQLEDYIESFEENMDEEIDLYREGKDYREAFTIRESVKDFENWVEYIKGIIEELKGVK
jgi:predicted unusual protein kinase regulating ubiquinone biosynthesis (AarF/ABC1/UbiB family)